MTTLFDGDGYSFIDVGGDEGAVALGMYRGMIKNVPHDVYFVVNMYRPLIASPSDAIECMREIEEVSGLRVTKIINNSSLGSETDAAAVLDSMEYARECASLAALPLAAHTYAPEYTGEISTDGNEPLMPIHDITKKLF